MQHGLPDPAWMLVNTIANIGIVVGYVLVPFTVLRYMPLTRNVLASGTLFFLTCATTHLSMAVPFIGYKTLVINHVVQAVAVVWFVLAFFALLRKANMLKTWKLERLRRAETVVVPPPTDVDGPA